MRPPLDWYPLRIKAPGETTDADPLGLDRNRGPENDHAEEPSGEPRHAEAVDPRLSGLRARVGAGVFRGTLVLKLQNDELHGGTTVRLVQTVTLVIAGSRVVSAKVEPTGTKPLRVGTKPTVEAVIESVEKVRPDAANELDPGWWLVLNDTERTRNDRPVVLARVPLHIRVKPESAGAFFASRRETIGAGI